MENNIRILLVEDNDSDVLLAEAEIDRELGKIDLKVVETRDQYIQALESFDPDLIISDYNLPAFNGLDALKIKQQIKPEVPLIIFTGTINEDTAVECMKAGAADYIIKEFMKRLGAAVVNALEQKKIATNRKITEESLRQKTEELDLYFTNSLDLLCIMDVNGYFRRLNPEWEKTLGFPVDFLLGKQLTDFVHPEDIKSTFESISYLTTEHKLPNFVNRIIHVDGSYRWIEWRSFSEGKLIYGVARDITTRRQSEILQQVVSEIAQIINNTNNIIEFYKEIHKTIQKVMPANNFYIANYDYNSDFINFIYFADEVDQFPGDRKSGRGLTELVIRTGKSLLCTHDKTIELINQQEVILVGTLPECWLGVPLLNDGKTIGVMVVQHYANEKAYGEKEKEILEFASSQIAKAIEKKEAELQIQKLSELVKQSPISIIITDPEGNIEYSNPAFSSLTGYQPDEVKGKNPRILKSKVTSPEIHKELWNCIKSGKAWNGEMVNKKKNNELNVVSTLIAPILDKDGRMINFLAIYEDITHKKQIEKDLIIAKEMAQESDRLKSSFLQNISHEIRTPLNAIIGFSGLLNKKNLTDEKRQNFTDIIISSGEQLLSVVTDILTISTLETGQEEIDIQAVKINEIFYSIQEVFKGLALNKNLVFSAKTGFSDEQSTVYTDRTSITQIISNLIGNALKFTHNGSVEFGYKLQNEHDGVEKELLFYVKDTGIGIRPQMQTKIFERFRQADSSIAVDYGGTGLGLSISKGLVQLLGGRIWVQSEPGNGATFYFTIPYKPAN